LIAGIAEYLNPCNVWVIKYNDWASPDPFRRRYLWYRRHSLETSAGTHVPYRRAPRPRV